MSGPHTMRKRKKNSAWNVRLKAFHSICWMITTRSRDANWIFDCCLFFSIALHCIVIHTAIAIGQWKWYQTTSNYFPNGTNDEYSISMSIYRLIGCGLLFTVHIVRWFRIAEPRLTINHGKYGAMNVQFNQSSAQTSKLRKVNRSWEFRLPMWIEYDIIWKVEQKRLTVSCCRFSNGI